MHRLTDIELDFNCQTLDRAQWFNASAEQLWQQELLPVAQQVLDEFDIAAKVQLDEICLQLPPLCLPADRYLLQHSFRQALRSQLWLLLPQATSVATGQQQQLTAAQRNDLIAALKSADTAALTLHWPLYRRFANELVLLLRQLAASGDICSVLAFGLSSDMLAELVQLLAPTEQRFVLQLMAQPQLFAITPSRLSGAARQQVQLPAPALRQRQRHLWQLSLSFLLVERGSRFNRQSYLHYLLQRMAAHDNVSLQALVQHMLLTLVQSQRYFAAHSPLLLQLTELLQPLLPRQQSDRVTAAPTSAVAYFSQRRLVANAALPAIKRQAVSRQASQGDPRKSFGRWQQWQFLLRQNRLTLAQQRQFNTLLAQLLQQNSSLWLDQLRQQLQLAGLLPSLVQYAEPELLQRLFQQLQPASVAAITPYIRLLHWALAAINLPLPLQQQARWLPLLQCALQRQPLTLKLLLLQLQLWLQAQQGAVAGRQTLQQLAAQLQYYADNVVLSTTVNSTSAQSQVAKLWQQLQWQLAVTAPWATAVRPLLAAEAVTLRAAVTTALIKPAGVSAGSKKQAGSKALALNGVKLAAADAAPAAPKATPWLKRACQSRQRADTPTLALWQQLVSLLVQALPVSARQQAQQLCQQLVMQCLPATVKAAALTSKAVALGAADIAAQNNASLSCHVGVAETSAWQTAPGMASGQSAVGAAEAASAGQTRTTEAWSGTLSDSRVLTTALLTTVAGALAPACTAVFYRQLQRTLQQGVAGAARKLLLMQLQRLLQYLAPAQLQHQREPGTKQGAKHGIKHGIEQATKPGTAQVLAPAMVSGLVSNSPEWQSAPLSADTATANAAADRLSGAQQQMAGEAVGQNTVSHQANLPGQAKRTAPSWAQQHSDSTEDDMQAAASIQWVSNAGLVLAAPYLPMLWQRLGWLEAQRFSRVQHAWQACALLHYMATGESTELISADYWQQWRLGMLLCGLQPPYPAGVDITLSTAQLELADSLLAGILAQWPKLANSSIDTLRQCFLQRGGGLSSVGNGSGWQLQLDSGPYDMLLDGLPWSFSLICHPWMQGELYVHWRG
ncbi:contractile injection system tape measure protein [Rheinheimera gaetbuli]